MAEVYKSGTPEKDRIIDPAADSSKQLSVFERKLQQVQEEANNLRAQAEQEAEILVNQAKSEAESITTKAYEEGITKGKTESIELINQLAGSLRNEIENFQKTHTELLAKSRSCIIDFGLKLARLIIGDEIKSDPSLIEKHLERIFERLTVDGTVDIFVSSEDFETIETYMRESGTAIAPNGFEIKADPSLGRGGIRVDSSTMGVDGSIEGMLKRVEGVVLDMLNEDG
jgi:flagellar biosynthesis/type III secretory pathway protein FliH